MSRINTRLRSGHPFKTSALSLTNIKKVNLIIHFINQVESHHTAKGPQQGGLDHDIKQGSDSVFHTIFLQTNRTWPRSNTYNN